MFLYIHINIEIQTQSECSVVPNSFMLTSMPFLQGGRGHLSRNFLRVFVLSNIAFISARHRCTAGLGVWWWSTVAASRHLLVLAGINPLIVPSPDINNNNATCGQWSPANQLFAPAAAKLVLKFITNITHVRMYA